MRLLIVDGANVVGSRPDGWWRDRAGAAERLHAQLSDADLCVDEIVLVLEGAARNARGAGRTGRIRTVHAEHSGDDAVVDEVRAGVDKGFDVTAATADRALQVRVEAVGGQSVRPSWLLEQLGPIAGIEPDG